MSIEDNYREEIERLKRMHYWVMLLGIGFGYGGCTVANLFIRIFL